MRTTDLYTNKIDCCGCELCSIICPRNIIAMRADEEGFLYPFIQNESLCINCRQCLSVCPAKTPGRVPNQIIDSYGGHLLEIESVKKSSSGGYATAISQAFIKNGGVVYGARYTNDYYGVTFSRAISLEELEPFRTSKYCQAKKGNIYKDVLKDLLEHRKVLFIGLPCEISALYHYVGKCIDNLFTISLVCHGPTSQKVQKDFVDSIESKLKSKINSFSVRYKQDGWKPYYILAKSVDGKVCKQKFNVSSYGTAFLYMKRPSCSICKYKQGNDEFGLQSDITLGDFHSVRKNMPHYNKWGVSQLSIQSQKGKFLFEMIKQTCKLEYISPEKINIGNVAFQKALPMKKGREKYVKAYLNHSLYYANYLPFIIFHRYCILFQKINKFVFAAIKHILKYL